MHTTLCRSTRSSIVELISRVLLSVVCFVSVFVCVCVWRFPPPPQVIKKLITALEETALFVRALAHLVFLEKEFDDTLLDYYLYYAAMVRPKDSNVQMIKIHCRCIHTPHHTSIQIHAHSLPLAFPRPPP